MAISIEDATWEMYNELRGNLPNVLAETESVSANFFNSFVFSLARSLGVLYHEINNMKDDALILTASASGIVAWESFLRLPARPDINIEARRGRIYSRLAGTFCTVATLKNIIRTHVNGAEFELFEYWTLGIPASAFNYKVIVYQDSSSETYDKAALLRDLSRVHPAHCGDAIEVIDAWTSFTESFTFTDSVTASYKQFFIIGSSLIGGDDVIVP